VVPERPEPRYASGLARRYALAVAEAKADDVAERIGRGVVVAADTIVVLDGEVLGKPPSRAEARRMLERLSGRTHSVLTAVAVMDAGTRRALAATDSAHLTLRRLSADEIDGYLDTGEPMDKAGAYALQGEAARFVTRIGGDPETAIGLPTRLVQRLLERLG